MSFPDPNILSENVLTWIEAGWEHSLTESGGTWTAAIQAPYPTASPPALSVTDGTAFGASLLLANKLTLPPAPLPPPSPPPVTNILWQWNGVDTSQFVNNPLPGPSFSGGLSIVNPELAAVATPFSPSQFVLRLSADETVNGSAVWLITDEVPFEQMKSVEIRCGIPAPGPAPSSGEQIAFGLVYAGDATVGTLVFDWLMTRDDGAGNMKFFRQVMMVDPAGPTYTQLYFDEFAGGGYAWSLRAQYAVGRNDTSYAGPPGVPCGQVDVQGSAFVPPPTTGISFPHGGTFVFNSAFLPPGTAWATSACNRIGLILGGAWLNATSGSQAMQIGSITILG